MQLSDSTPPARRPWSTPLLCAILLIAYLALRLPHLRELPVFCDESAYVHFGQMIHDDPAHNLFISMTDGKLPFHYWLLALTYPLNADPITAGRLLSVLTGAALIPILLLLGKELRRYTDARAPKLSPAATLFGPLAAAFMITSPLIASYQRMALAEPLLLLESITLATLSLRLARQITTSHPPELADELSAASPIKNPKSKIKNPLLTTTLLALTWSATLLTKQNFSYLLWLLPPLSLALYTTKKTLHTNIRSFLKPYLLATAASLTLFIPILFTDTTKSLATRLFYQSNLYQTPLPWSQIVTSNFFSLLFPRINNRLTLWPHSPEAPLQDGMLYLYFTPALFLLLLTATIQLLRQKSSKISLYLLLWSLALLAPLLLSHNLLKARYALLGIFPLLLFTTWSLAEFLPNLTATLKSKIKNQKSKIPSFATSAFITLLLTWPLCSTIAQNLSPNAPTRTQSERDEYISDLSGGQAWQNAVTFLLNESAHHPITVITGPGFSLNNDFLWLTFHNNPNIHLYCTNDLPLKPLPPLPNTPGYTFLLSPDQWRPQLARPTQIPSHFIYTIGIAVFDPDTGNVTLAQPPDSFLPAAQLISYFQNPPLLPSQHPSTGVALLGTRPPSQLSSPINPNSEIQP